MRKSIILLWVVLILPITSLLAQTEENEREVYNQLKEWAVVKLTIAYMEDLYSFTPAEKGKSGSDLEYRTYKNLTENLNTEDKDINLEEVGSILIKGSWETTKSKVFDKYKTELIENNKRINFNNIEPFGYNNRSKNNFNSTLKEIQNEYKNEIDALKLTEVNNKEDEEEIDIVEKNSKNSNPEVGQQEEKKNVIENNESSFNSSLISFGIIGLLMILNILMFLRIKNNNPSNNQKSEDEIVNPTDKGLENEKNLLENKIKELEKEKNVLEKEKNVLENKIKELEKEIDECNKIQKQNSNTVNLEPNKENTINYNKPTTESKIIYLPSPFKELTFANENASSHKETNSIYRVELSNENQTGKLFIMEDADFTRALNSPDTFLKTVCVYENEFSNNARMIKNVEAGETILEGEDWRVTKKVRIKFI